MLDEFKNWANKPFSVDMTALQWFAFFGLLIAINLGWYIIMREIRDIVEG